MPRISLEKIKEYLFYILVFVLPWQVRWIARDHNFGGVAFEYGRISLYAFDIVLIILFIVSWSSYFIFKKEKAENKFNNKAIVVSLILAIYCFVTISWAAEKFVAFYWAVRMFLAWGAFYLMQGINFSKIRLAITIVGAGFVQGFLSWWQFINQSVWSSKWLGMAAQRVNELGVSVVGVGEERWLRAYGSWPHPNILGGFLVVSFVFWVYLLGKVKDQYQKRFILITGFFIISGIFLSFSRGAWLVFLILYLWSWFYINRKMPNIKAKNFLVGTAMIMIIMLIIYRPLVATRLGIGGEGRLEIKSNTERVLGHHQAVEIFSKNIVGVGIGNYAFKIKDYYKIDKIWEVQPVHNVYLLVIVELGIVGFLILVIIFFYLLFYLYQRKRYFLLVLFMSFLFLGLWDHYFWTLPAGLYGVFLGLGLFAREV